MIKRVRWVDALRAVGLGPTAGAPCEGCCCVDPVFLQYIRCPFLDPIDLKDSEGERNG